AGLIGRGILEAVDRDGAGLLDLLLGPVHDVDRLAAPEDLDVLTIGDRRKIDLDRRAGRDRRGVRIHLGNERPGGEDGAYGRGRPGCHKEEITACRMVRRRRCRRHDSKPFLKLRPGGTAPETPIGHAREGTTPRRDRRWPAGARDPRGGRETGFFSQGGQTSGPESFYWHPCRESASPLSAPKRAMHEIGAERCFIHTIRQDLIGCRSRFSSPTFPRTPAPFCGSARAWM